MLVVAQKGRYHNFRHQFSHASQWLVLWREKRGSCLHSSNPWDIMKAPIFSSKICRLQWGFFRIGVDTWIFGSKPICVNFMATSWTTKSPTRYSLPLKEHRLLFSGHDIYWDACISSLSGELSSLWWVLGAIWFSGKITSDDGFLDGSLQAIRID